MANEDDSSRQPLLAAGANLNTAPAPIPNGVAEPPTFSDHGDGDARGWARVTCKRPGVEVAMLLYVINIAIGITATQQYIYVKIANELNYTGPRPGEPMTDNCTEANTSDPLYMKQQEVQDVASAWYTYNSMCLSLTAFFTTVFLGGYSDRGGRKIALLFPMIGSLCSTTIYLFVTIYDLPKFVILIGSVLDGLSGYFTTFMMGCNSYVVDQSTRSQRSFRIVLLETVSSMGVFIATLAGGFLIVGIGFRGVYLILVGIGLLNIAYVTFILRESNTTPSRDVTTTRDKKYRGLLSCEHFTKSLMVFRDSGNRPPHYLTMFLSSFFILFLLATTVMGRMGVQTLHYLDTPFCWSSILLGIFTAACFLCSAVGSLVVTKLFQKRFGDLKLLQLGLCSLCALSMAIALAPSTGLAFIAPPLGSFVSLTFSMLRSFLSKLVNPDEIGAMFSWMAWTESITSLMAQIMFNTIYHATLYWFNSFVFLLMAAIAVVAIILTGFLQWKAYQSKRAMLNRPNTVSHGGDETIVTPVE